MNERDLRRAYARLIRKYKPEQFPEHFRRIREAYEAAQHYAQFFTPLDPPAGMPGVPTEPPPAEPDEVEAPEAGNLGTPAGAPRPPPALPRSFEQELEEAWDLAIVGDEAQAYALLLDLQMRHPAHPETSIRLYCLLSIAPELDTRRTPCDFLAHGLRLTGGGGLCHELYRREIEDNPGEAFTERFVQLLNTTTQPGLVETFVRWRWRAAESQGRLDVIVHDLADVRRLLAVDQEEHWLRLLSFAADQLAFASADNAPAGLQTCLKEVRRLEHLQLRCAEVFDRLENLEHTAAGWHTLRTKRSVPSHLLELLSRLWTRPFTESRRDVMSLLAAMSTETKIWLSYLDRVNKASPLLLGLFGTMLDSYEACLDPKVDGREATEVTVLARHFLEEHGRRGYPALRSRLLAFCLREWIHPEVIAQLALSQTVVLPEDRLNHLVADWPLRHVYRACFLFRT